MASKTLQDMVLAASSLHSGKIAVTFDKGITEGGPMLLYYHELVALGNELTLFLQIQCVQNTRAIALYCQPDINLPVWILGILQLPAAYVPLDPDAPALLSARVMKQCGLKYCQFQMAFSNLMSIEVCAVWSAHNLTLVLVQHRPTAARKEEPNADLFTPAAVPESASQGALAYILHTSGTTGLPKTVRVPHKCIVPNILHLRSLFQMTPDDVVFLASPLTFDPSVVEIFLALSSGARLLIVPTAIKRMPNRLAHVLFKKHKTTVLQVTPTLLGRFGRRVLQEEVLSAGSSLRVLALGGEACPSLALLRSWRQQGNCTHIYNIYGITEVSCWACCYHLPESLLQSTDMAESSVPLGPPLMETTVELRDEDGCVITQGEGQVFIGGLDRVCLLDDEVTVAPGTMRSTGDWVQMRDTHLYFLGRRDRLVKRHGQRLHLDTLQQVTCSTGLQKAILHRLSQVLPSHSVPDTLVLVPALPLSSHGKVSMGELMKIYQRQRAGSESHSALGDMETLRERLQSLWRETLGLTEDKAIQEDSNFLLSGGDSLQALRLCDDITTAVGVTSSGLLEVILDGSFSEILRHVAIATLPFPSEHSRTSHPVSMKRPADPVSSVQPKRHIESNHSQTFGSNKWTGSNHSQAVETNDPSASSVTPPSREAGGLGLVVSWESDTGRCVDASPVLLVQRGADGSSGGTKATVFIGSHSHRMQALDLTTGGLLWERVLGDRIESSSAVSRCGRLVVVGCYDGGVYFLCVESGETQWVFETGDAVKSCPTVDPLTGLVMVGSHDGHVYALDPQVRQCVWKRHCGCGAVFSSPCLHPSLRQLYVATLGGHLLCLNPDTGAVLWTYSRKTPFFSSPSCSSGHIIIGSVDGNICCFSHTGEMVWQYVTNGPVFSSPCITPDKQRVVCGSHDGCVYCLNRTDGSLVWRYQTPSRVYSSPCVFDGSAWGKEGTLVGLASTDGTLCILDGEDGTLRASLSLLGELFSSPVVWERSLVVGCRNDFVYCVAPTGELK
uniref:Carrier domain-containing protein n=1 Tax=Oncorhynchus tshawytscha TaxID=74940 RepID=A0A8C8M6F4_ONCTS